MNPNSIRLRLATGSEFRAFCGCKAPQIWFGIAALEDERVVAIGFVFWRWDERAAVLRAWGGLQATRRLPALILHRTARKTLAYLRDRGEPALYAFCDEKIPGAEKWLRRLGFAPDPALDYGQPVWSVRFADG